jgi:hypothetical protein
MRSVYTDHLAGRKNSIGSAVSPIDRSIDRPCRARGRSMPYYSAQSMTALHCRQCNEPFDLGGSAFWAGPTGEERRQCVKCGADLRLGIELTTPSSAERAEVEELGDEDFSALSSGIIDTKRPGSIGALEREAREFARALVRAQLMDAVSDGPPSSRDEEDTVVIGPMASRAKRAALAKMAAERAAAAKAEAQEKTLATTPSDELLEMSAPDASERITADVETVRAVQNSTEEPERRLPFPPARPEPIVIEEVLEEIEAAPVSDGGTPSLQALIGHPISELHQGVKLSPVRDKSGVPKPPERHKDEVATASTGAVPAASDDAAAATEDEVVESVDLASIAERDAPDSDRPSDAGLQTDAGEVPTLAPTNVTAPPVQSATIAASASRSRWATPLSFAALGSLFAVLVALRTPKEENPVAVDSEQPASVVAARAVDAPQPEPVGAAAAEQPRSNVAEPQLSTPEPAIIEGAAPEPAAVTPPEAAAAPAQSPTLAAAVVTPTAAKPRAKAKAKATEPFDASAANASLAEAQARASSCRKSDDPSGVAQVTITFAPSGRVTTALVAGPPFAGTPTGGCVASTLRSARVPAFVGDPVTVRKTVTIQ